MSLQIGDEVVLAIDVKEFKKTAEEGGCDRRYIQHFVDGHSAVISGLYANRLDGYISFQVDGLEESNWFYSGFFKRIESELCKIKQESQRL